MSGHAGTHAGAPGSDHTAGSHPADLLTSLGDGDVSSMKSTNKPIDCALIHQVFDPHLKETYSSSRDDYPTKAKYCVELVPEPGIQLSLGPLNSQKYRYYVWQLYTALPRFKPSYRPTDVFPSTSEPGVIFEFGKFLGRGTYGEAYLGLCLNNNMEVFEITYGKAYLLRRNSRQLNRTVNTISIDMSHRNSRISDNIFR